MRETRVLLLITGLLLSALGIFVLDAFFLPLGSAVWLPYIVVVLASLWLPRPWQTYSTAALCSVFTLVGLFLSSSGEQFWLASFHRRVLAVATLWAAAAIGLKARRTKELERSNKALQEEIQRREKLERQLLRTQRLESIGVLTGGIAHDFNNLLTPILMATKLLQEERPDEERRRLLETLQASAERAAELVRKLLAFAGGMGGERSAVEVKDVITETKEIVEHTFPQTIVIQTNIADDLPTVLADPTQLSQVLMNLCVNARDAMPSGGRLSLTAQKADVDDSYVRTHPEARSGIFIRIAVEDTGCGMSPEILDQAFDPFFTTKTQDKGTGLGLSTALGIVRSHGGFLHVDSQVGRGSQFAIYLPAQSVKAKKSEVLKKAAARRGNGELVLVVDDEPPTLQTVKAVLQSGGYRALTASSGAEALEIYERNCHQVQAVLLDMMMPGMDGLAVMAKLQEMDAEVRIIASSGLHITGHAAQTLVAKGMPFLPKPYSDEQLLAALARLLQTP